MSDLISRQEAIDICANAIDLWRGQLGEGALIAVRDKIKELPPAQPEIIRRKDCKHWDTTWQNDYSPNYHYCPMIDGTHRNDFYCAYAERKEEAT